MAENLGSLDPSRGDQVKTFSSEGKCPDARMPEDFPRTQVTKIDREGAKVKAEIKKAAKQGQMEGAKILAREV